MIGILYLKDRSNLSSLSLSQGRPQQQNLIVLPRTQSVNSVNHPGLKSPTIMLLKSDYYCFFPSHKYTKWKIDTKRDTTLKTVMFPYQKHQIVTVAKVNLKRYLKEKHLSHSTLGFEKIPQSWILSSCWGTKFVTGTWKLSNPVKDVFSDLKKIITGLVLYKKLCYSLSCKEEHNILWRCPVSAVTATAV